jgi:hypothetical protein
MAGGLGLPTGAGDAIVRAETKDTARFGLTARSNLGTIDFGVVGPTRAGL